MKALLIGAAGLGLAVYGLTSLAAGRGDAPPPGDEGPSMIAIPAGKLPPEAEPDGGTRGDNQRSKLLPAFAIDRTEVTAEQYASCVRATACAAVDPKARRCNVNRGAAFRRHPANCVTWGQADAFCRWRDARLPTSDEWERAARGDQPRKYPWGDQLPGNQLCWQREPGGADGTCPVGAHPSGASPFGVLDLAGNVAEWTASEKPRTFEKEYLIRGGGFAVEDLAMAEPDDLDFRADRSSPRSAVHGAVDLGFRCVKGEPIEASHPPTGQVGAPAPAYTPTAGTPERKAMLDAVRAALKTRSEFKVGHLRASGDWAYFEGRESIGSGAAPPPVRAILHRTAAGQWQATDTCTASDDSPELEAFRTKRATIPATLLPPSGQ